METEGEFKEARILVADDDAQTVLLLERILESAGYGNVASTTDPRDILPAFQGPKPDILVLDLHMPEMDAFEVIAAIRPQLEPGEVVPTMILTGDVTPEMRRKALVTGVDDFVLKPFQPAEVLMRIDHQLQRRFGNLATRGVTWEPGRLVLSGPESPTVLLMPIRDDPAPDPSIERLLMDLYATLTTGQQLEALNRLRAAMEHLPGEVVTLPPTVEEPLPQDQPSHVPMVVPGRAH